MSFLWGNLISIYIYIFYLEVLSARHGDELLVGELGVGLEEQLVLALLLALLLLLRRTNNHRSIHHQTNRVS